MNWVGKDLKDHLVPTPPPWVGIPPTRFSCSGPHPTWPWTMKCLSLEHPRSCCGVKRERKKEWQRSEVGMGWDGTAYMDELAWQIQLPAFCPTFCIWNGWWHDTEPLALVLGLFLILLGFFKLWQWVIQNCFILFCNQDEEEGLVGNL